VSRGHQVTAQEALMTPEKSKRQVQYEIEAARQLFLKTGRRMQRLKAETADDANLAKPRKQRLGLYA
jgi:hypothetical protein